MKRITWLKINIKDISERLAIPLLKDWLEDGEPEAEWDFFRDLEDLCEEIEDEHPELDSDFWESSQFEKDGTYILRQVEKFFNKKKKAYWSAVKRAEQRLFAI